MSDSNTPDFGELLSRARHIAFGAVANLLEVVQDPAKRQATVEKLQADLKALAEELETKGLATEQEARGYAEETVEELKDNVQSLREDLQKNETVQTLTGSPATSPADSAAAIRELTEQIQSLRRELEKINDQSPPSE